VAYPFVAARYDYGPRKGPSLALLIHMAEGGNTVSYLHNAPARGVSVHFVAEYSGKIVQMVPLGHASGSVNPKTLRTDEGPAPYGASVAKEVLGNWWSDPNNAVISIEVEGFANVGPNAQQMAALMLWADDMRAQLPNLTGALGHRDFQNVKACPGARIAWNSLGGHGLWHGSGPEEPIVGPTFQPKKDRIGGATISAVGANVIQTADGQFTPAGMGKSFDVYALVRLTNGKYTGQEAYLVYANGLEAGLLLTGLATFVPGPVADCGTAVAAEHERTRQQAIDAVTAIP
jgi:hypothetical protein